MKKNTSRHWKIILQVAITSLAAIIFVSAIAYSATTISTNIDTDGNVTVGGNVGIGTTTPTALLSVESGSSVYPRISIKKTGDTGWTQVGGDGLNSGWNDASGYEKIHTAIVYNGKLYAGFARSTGDGDVWEYDGSTWTQIGGDGLRSSWSNVTIIWKLMTFNGKLLAGITSGAAGTGDLWEYDGTIWTQIAGDGLNSSWPANSVNSVESFTVLGGKLYVGLGDGTGDADVWEYDGADWTKVGGDSVNSSWDASTFCYSLGTYNDKVYAGLGGNPTGPHVEAEVWEYDGSAWTQIGGDDLNSSWASSSYYYIMDLKEYDDKLYAGAGLGPAGSGVYGDIWEYDGSAWTQIGGGEINSSWADLEGEAVQTIEVYNGEMYVGLAGVATWPNVAGMAEVWKYNGSSWSKVGGDGIGWADATYERVRDLVVYNGKLYAMLGEDTADAEVWVYESYETDISKLSDGLLLGSNFKFDNYGKLGINNLIPERELDIIGNLRVFNHTLDTFGGNVSVGDISTTTGAKFTIRQSGTNNILNIKDASTTIFTILDGGNVGISTTTPGYVLSVKGDTQIFEGGLCVDDGTWTCPADPTDGTIYAEDTSISEIDLAENYLTKDETLEAGEVVSIDIENPEHVIRETQPYSPNLLGVVSTKPGILLGGNYIKQGEEYRVPVALSGRVPVKISLENGPIKIGDPLTSASEPGYATKAMEPGRIIGYALENILEETASSTIVIFVDTGWNPNLSVEKIIIEQNNATLVGGNNTVFREVIDVLRRIGITVKDSVVQIAELVVDRITASEIDTKEIRTQKINSEELCLDDVCINKEQLKQILGENPDIVEEADEIEDDPEVIEEEVEKEVEEEVIEEQEEEIIEESEPEEERKEDLPEDKAEEVVETLVE